MDNSIKYISPDLSGFKVGIGYAGKNTKTTGSDGFEDFEARDTSNWITTGASYDNGPLSVGVSYDRFRTDVRLSNGAGEKVQPICGICLAPMILRSSNCSWVMVRFAAQWPTMLS
ncbi:porin [Advenella kashmirensis]|nr:porin [Advenella kashmirensis]